MSSNQMPAPGKTKLIKFPPSRAGKDVKCPGYARGGGMLKLRFDWYIRNKKCLYSSSSFWHFSSINNRHNSLPRCVTLKTLVEISGAILSAILNISLAWLAYLFVKIKHLGWMFSWWKLFFYMELLLANLIFSDSKMRLAKWIDIGDARNFQLIPVAYLHWCTLCVEGPFCSSS